jgi:hypothetical protein
MNNVGFAGKRAWERADLLLDQRGEGNFDVARGTGVHDQQFLPERGCRGPDFSHLELAFEVGRFAFGPKADQRRTSG